MSHLIYESRQPQHEEILVERKPVKEGQKLSNQCNLCLGVKHVMMTCGMCNHPLTLQCARCGSTSWAPENHSSCL